VLEMVRSLAARLRRPKIACLGLSYKPDIDDLRESPALHVARSLAADGDSELVLVEPHLQRSPIDGVPLASLDEALRSADIVVILVAHRQFRHLRPDHLLRLMVVDTVGLLNPRT
jgi:UDP-N-acetyl-D-mannosaminuronic acid dehydrogenase